MPNIVNTEYVFQPEEQDESVIHPILGTKEVRNIFDFDWSAIKQAQSLEWANVCQEHYEMVVKLGNQLSTPMMTKERSRNASRLG